MSNRHRVLTTLILALLGGACSQQERERIGAIPSQSESQAKQVEAQQLLRQIHAMQQAYYSANMQYGTDLGTIGVTLPTNSRYSYSLSSAGATWNCRATANLDLDPTIDTWVVDQAGGVICTANDATS